MNLLSLFLQFFLDDRDTSILPQKFLVHIGNLLVYSDKNVPVGFHYAPEESVTVKLKLTKPVPEGVPLMMPDDDNVKPEGSGVAGSREKL